MTLALTDATMRYGKRTVLDRVSFTLAPGSFTVLVGPNGAGKSSLLRALGGLAPLQGGSASLDGHDLSEMPARERAKAIGWLPQRGGVAWPIAVEQVVALGRHPYSGVDSDHAVEAALAACDVAHLAQRSFTALSGGEQSRVLLARALAGEPRFLLVDEPIADLDPAHQLDALALLRTRATDRVGVLAILHDLALASRVADRVVLLQAGRIVGDGEARAVLTHDALRDVFNVAAHIEDEPFFVLPWERRSPERR
ncbi:ABC transporter ATP-binding protein [Roseiterribacter gracilis]|uniref:ABC transporter n=1 Tax=Roseiterribacter gracilis TaxID=2812848 RepID=A0A8S8XCU8_9PROT|nr:ABC transporter [Rhodospirillales bacterium TMPK1]